MLTPFVTDNEKYEKWLGGQCELDRHALSIKHCKMAANPFRLLRATYFRWTRMMNECGPDLLRAHQVLAVGDAHVENFGTWRDRNNRLVWGVNDFDDAAQMPWPLDLVRLATSVRLMEDGGIRGKEASAAILDGYRAGLADPKPTLVDENAVIGSLLADAKDGGLGDLRDEAAPLRQGEPPDEVRAVLGEMLPGVEHEVWSRRIAGGGSLGRPRFMVIASWHGDHVVREAKALVPSAWGWPAEPVGASRFLDVTKGAFRSPDPYLTVRGDYVYRRLGVDSHKIELKDLKAKVTAQVLRAMGFDLASVHAATPGAPADILADLRGFEENWLHAASKQAAGRVENDWNEWITR